MQEERFYAKVGVMQELTCLMNNIKHKHDIKFKILNVMQLN